MRTLSRFFLLLLALIGVGALGYYAYVLGAETLTYPFLGSDEQKGDTLDLVVARPRFIVNLTGGPIIDEKAIRESLQFGTAALSDNPSISGEYSVTISGEHIQVSYPGLEKGQSVTLNSDIYNEKKTTRYRLPRDISLTPLEYPRSLNITPVGVPRDRTYGISMFGFEKYTPEHIRYFINYNKDIPCNLSSSWQEFSPIFPTIIKPLSRDGQIMNMNVQFDYDTSKSHVCLIGGVNGVYSVLEDRTLEDFVATGSTLEVLSPEYDMQSRIEFDFSYPIYEDTGSLYSPAYIANRSNAKIAFLKSLSISPDIAITPDNLILTPDHAILTLPLAEGKEVTFSLTNIADIYGRTINLKYKIVPKQEPFLSLKFQDDRTYYNPNEAIPTKLYALKAPKKTYSIKLCHLPLESYARMERILSEDMTGSSLDAVYSTLHGSDAYGCIKKDIDLTATGYVSNFDARNLAAGGKFAPGMYILAFTNRDDINGFQKPVKPLVFTVMDSHITMKVDASGKIMFLVTDIKTGEPLANQEVTVMRNVIRTYHEQWDSNTNETTREYIPLTSQAFATGVILGRTNNEGFLDVSLSSLQGLDTYESSPYSLSFESWWEYEGRYESFLVQSRGDSEHVGYLVSTWNDGITGYNFGMKESDYSYETRSKYTAYLHTERKLYLPGETVHIHGIIRENSTSLRVPGDVSFNVIVSDSMGKEINRLALKPNEFGTISADLNLGKDATLGMYSISLSTLDQTEYVQNGWTNFQVEVFKNPTFTANVELKSPDIENGTIKNLRKKQNTDQNNPWYENVYEGKFALDGVVKAKYYNGTEIRNTPFTYRIYRNEYYADNYWSDCFWGCYYEPSLEYYTEGTGMIDQDGYGVFSVPVDYTSYYSDYQYTAEVIIKDPLSGEEVTTPSTLVVKLPAEYKSFSPNNPITFTPKKKILQNGEELQGDIKPQYGSWDASLSGKYNYEIIYREYRETPVDDIRSGKINITTSTDRVMGSGTVTNNTFTKKLIAYPSGEYIFRISPIALSGATVPDSAISETLFYIAGDMMGMRGNTLRVIPEKTVYKPGDTARVLVTVPFTGSHILMTVEKGGVMKHEYFTLSGNTFTREYKVDDTMIPNAYIGVTALNPSSPDSKRSYAVGYGEIVSDYAEKKGNLTLNPDKETYKNRETVNLDMTLTDRSGNPLQGEVAVMVVDESLIRLLGNIDLDILPKFYQKYPFTVKTALSFIGIERNHWLSRKGSNGGSGDKGGAGNEIASRSLFKNTAYYNPSVRTDASGKANVRFELPDNVTDYRIITIANTKDAHFAVSEKTIQVRKDYVIETHAPMILRPNDSSNITTSVFNSTKKITGATLTAIIGTGSNVIRKSLEVTLNPGESLSRDFGFSAQGGWSGSVPYTIELREKNTLLDSYTSSFRFTPIPEIESTSRNVLLFTGTTFSYTLPKVDPSMDLASSKVSISISTSYATQLSEAIKSLVQYPYGCIEQTIGSTLPNALALAFSNSLGIKIDRAQATENIKNGLEKILRMQHYSGGWVYWEGQSEAETHITPYVLRSLVAFRNLGQNIPDEVLENGANYIINNLSTYREDENSFAEAVWTLALLGRTPEALENWKTIDTKKLSRHGYLAYAYAAHVLTTYSPEIAMKLDNLMFSTGTTNDYWYWDKNADEGIYAQLLIDRGDDVKALALIDRIVRDTDLTSYYISTQAKIQIFRALVKQANKASNAISKNHTMAFRGDAIIADATLTPNNPTVTIDTTREKIGSTFSLNRDESKLPIYVTITTRDRTKSILDMPAKNALGMSISRTFDLIDESKGIAKDGTFISATPIKDGKFQKGKLYRVTLRTVIPGNTNEYNSWYNLAIEDFYPAGWRPINSNFTTESALTHSNSNDWWNYTESRDDRMLTHIDYGYGNERIYIYYVRPITTGTYLLPPATSYFMYRPEVHAYTKYEKVQITE